jgi:hypothetical protein
MQEMSVGKPDYSASLKKWQPKTTGNRTVWRSLITSQGMTGSQKDDTAEGVLDSQDQETSQPAKLYKVN